MAFAHLRSGTVAVDYGASVSSPRPSATAAFSVGVYESDRALHLTVRRGHRVVVLGYLGGPFLRIDAAGVWVDAGSPTAAAAGLLQKGTPARGWRLERGHRAVVWHDGRVQGLRPGAGRATWRVPIVVDGRRSAIVGEVWRVPPPALWPWLLVALLVAGLVATLGFRRGAARLRRASVAFGLVAAGCALAAAAGFALGAYASAGTWFAAVDEAAFGLACVGVLAWGPRGARAAAGVGLGVLGLAVGLENGAVFLHSVVLSVVPGTMTRALIAVSVGAGVGAAAAGVRYYARQGEVMLRALSIR